MSGTPDDDRLEELREQKKEQLRQQADGQQRGGKAAQEQAAREQADGKQEAMLKQNRTDDDPQRLNAIEIS